MQLFNDERIRDLMARKGRTYAPDTFIFLEEEQGAEMYIIVSGEVEIQKTFREHELFGGARLTLGDISETLAILKAGDFFGEMALWNDEPRMATARARTQVEVIVLKKDDLEALMLRSPQLAIQMLKSICSRLRDVASAPRLDAALPAIQQIIRDIQNSRRPSPAKAAGASPKKDAIKAEKPEIPSGTFEASVNRCAACSTPIRPGDKFCSHCGKSLSAS